MIEATRRNFLIGSSAALTALMLSPQLKALDGILVRGVIQPRMRRVYDILISCVPFPSDTVISHTLYKNNHVMLAMNLNGRATLRWVAVPDGELLFTKNDVMRYEINPSFDGMQMCFHCNGDDGIKYAEYFRWENDRLVQTDCAPLSYPFEQWAEQHGMKAA
jgi:hypothetical protein